MYDLSDTILLQKIRIGCEKAFREVYDRYHVQMFYIAKKYIKDTTLAEDVVQDVFVKLWEKKHKLDHVQSLKGYLFTMVRNHVLNMIRDRKSDLISISGVSEKKLPAHNLTEENLQYSEYETILKRGISELSDRKREVFELRTKRGLTNAEVAELLQIHVRTVKTHYYNSSKFIRTYLKNHAGILTFLIVCLQAIFLKS
ncbi:RNA polymerase sigma-70 factor [Rhodohalobacter sp. SW132]|uniref:RNA polymerase sigma factor n=1 Tax=Rhodohalobacter sp. SW132 TaxID=2293433 RepID=UPI000E23919C|nr:RNA polymerase sigma-70 factor [Rhodohalobacter sp. SW132]REL32944.1 RNA polymerase sigma-70 factor [Rhodohalobacter sp. SW132]